MNKLKIWIISDEPPTKIGIENQLKNYPISTKNLEWDIVGQHLVNCERLEGYADIIIMDLSALTLSNNMDKHHYRLRHFLRKHSTSIFHLVCFVYKNAQDTIEELKTIFDAEEVIMTSGPNGEQEIALYMLNQTVK